MRSLTPIVPSLTEGGRGGGGGSGGLAGGATTGAAVGAALAGVAATEGADPATGRIAGIGGITNGGGSVVGLPGRGGMARSGLAVNGGGRVGLVGRAGIGTEARRPRDG
jgi:hypothetical protein